MAVKKSEVLLTLVLLLASLGSLAEHGAASSEPLKNAAAEPAPEAPSKPKVDDVSSPEAGESRGLRPRPQMTGQNEPIRLAKPHGASELQRRIPSEAELAAEAEAARVVAMILFVIVIGQYALYAWKHRALKSYQKATLAGLWTFPCLFCVYFKIWKFVIAWILYSISTGRYVNLTRRRPLPVLAPRRVYTWFNGMHKYSHFLVVLGYFVGLLDFCDLNPASLLLMFLPKGAFPSLHEPFPAQAELHEARMKAYKIATERAHAHHEAGLPPNVEKGQLDLGFELPGNNPEHKHAMRTVYFHEPTPPDSWLLEDVRMFCALSVVLGLYFGVLTRDVAEVCTQELSAALGLAKKDDEDSGGGDDDESVVLSVTGSKVAGHMRSNQSQRETTKDGNRGVDTLQTNQCALCGLALRPPIPEYCSRIEDGIGSALGAGDVINEQRRLNEIALANDPRLGASRLGTSSDDAGGKSMIEGGRALLQQVDVQQVVASAAGCAGAVAGVAGATIETLDALNKEPEPLFTLACGHTFHEACLRGWSIVGKQNSCPYCVEKVDLSKILGQSPWEKQGLVWIQLLDAVRYLVVWHPIILAVAHFGVRHVLGYHPLVVDQDHPAHADHDHIQHLKPIAPGQ